MKSEIAAESKNGRFLGFTDNIIFACLASAIDSNLEFEPVAKNPYVKTITNYQALIGYAFYLPFFEVTKSNDNFLVAKVNVDDFSFAVKPLAFLIRNKTLVLTFAAGYPLDNDHHPVGTGRGS